MKTMEPTWEPYEEHGRLTARENLPDTVFAFPRQRKEPLTDAHHVRNAVARFDQVIDVSDEDRALAFANIEKAAQYYGLNLSETNWQELGIHPQQNREEAAKKGVETRRLEREEDLREGRETAANRGAETRRREREEELKEGKETAAEKAAATRKRKLEEGL